MSDTDDAIRRFRRLGFGEAILPPEEWWELSRDRRHMVWARADGEMVMVVGAMLVWTWDEAAL